MMCEQEVRRNWASTGPGPIGVMHLLHHVPAATSILRRRQQGSSLAFSDDELGLLLVEARRSVRARRPRAATPSLARRAPAFAKQPLLSAAETGMAVISPGLTA